MPGSNINLPYTATFDVTELGVKNNNMKPHNWPTQYYLSAYRNKKVALIKETPQLQNYDLDKLITTH